MSGQAWLLAWRANGCLQLAQYGGNFAGLVNGIIANKAYNAEQLFTPPVSCMSRAASATTAAMWLAQSGLCSSHRHCTVRLFPAASTYDADMWGDCRRRHGSFAERAANL